MSARPLPRGAAIAALAVAAAVIVAGAVRGDEGPVSRGARIVALGNGRGAPACASCHGYNGSGDPSGAFPRLTGQEGHYLAYALSTFANGGRRSAVMTPIAKSLTQEDVDDVAAYYASLSAPVPPLPTSDGAAVERGRVIANVGINDQQIPSCVSCHGPHGRSVNPTVPSLAGQYSKSVVFALRMFSEGYRKSDQMSGLAHSLTEQQRNGPRRVLRAVGSSRGLGGEAARGLAGHAGEGRPVSHVSEEGVTSSAAAAPRHVAAPSTIDATREVLKNGPRGALTIASVSAGLLTLGWLAFYFLLFIPRGEVH